MSFLRRARRFPYPHQLDSLSVRLTVCTVVSIALHAALLQLMSPGGGYFARAQTQGRIGDARLLATLIRAAQVDTTEVVPGHAEVSTGLAAKPQPESADTPTPPASRPALDVGRANGAGDQIAYYGDKELDARPRLIGAIDPVSPDFTGRIKGSVVLRLRINAEGTVDNVMVLRAKPDYPFGPGAFSAFERARFVPAMKRGIPVASEMIVELNYGPDE